MTNRERFIRTLKCEKIGGQVPTFELLFCLTMEAFGRLPVSQRNLEQWNQMSYTEKKLHMKDMADLYIKTAQRYGHSAILLHIDPLDMEKMQWIMEEIREQSGDEYFLCMSGDVTFGIPDGTQMEDFCIKMYEEPEVLIEQTKRKLDAMLEAAAAYDKNGHLVDGFFLGSDLCLQTNPFYTCEMFDLLIGPYLKASIDAYRSMGYYSYKHTDGNIMPILKQIADCGPDAIHSLDPQAGVSIPEVRKIIGDDICLIGNVNCGLLQTGTDEECDADVMRSLREGMERGYGYIFSTSNCVYTGMPLHRYERMNALWREFGKYDF